MLFLMSHYALCEAMRLTTFDRLFRAIPLTSSGHALLSRNPAGIDGLKE